MRKIVIFEILIALVIASVPFVFIGFAYKKNIQLTREYYYEKGRLDAYKDCGNRLDEVLRQFPRDLVELANPGVNFDYIYGPRGGQ